MLAERAEELGSPVVKKPVRCLRATGSLSKPLRASVSATSRRSRRREDESVTSRPKRPLKTGAQWIWVQPRINRVHLLFSAGSAYSRTAARRRR